MYQAADGQNLERLCTQFLRGWDAENLVGRIEVEVSTRLRTSLGIAEVFKRRVRINNKVLECDISILSEVLCHELAHIVVFDRYGRAAKPHGGEWQELLKNAGYAPRVRIPLDGTSISLEHKCFEHYCPVCGAARLARRKMNRWRCGTCVSSGLEGSLLIRRIDP